MRFMIAILMATIGVFLWYWGSFHLAGRKSYLWKIHAMGISDTIGTLFILAGALVHSIENWPHLLLAMGSVVFWGTGRPAPHHTRARTTASRQVSRYRRPTAPH